MKTNNKNYLKISLVLFFCLFMRLLPFRAPNVEPVLAATMPISKAHGAFLGFSFAIFSILLYDLITGTLGVQTLFTLSAYGVLGLWSASYFKKHKVDKWGYAGFAVMGTLFYDAVTGLTVGPIFFHQSFFQTFIGQIPFTALHLTGNIILAFTLSPFIYNFVIKRKRAEKVSLISTLNPKII